VWLEVKGREGQEEGSVYSLEPNREDLVNYAHGSEKPGKV
jgi:hypothetical protein